MYIDPEDEESQGWIPTARRKAEPISRTCSLAVHAQDTDFDRKCAKQANQKVKDPDHLDPFIGDQGDHPEVLSQQQSMQSEEPGDEIEVGNSILRRPDQSANVVFVLSLFWVRVLEWFYSLYVL